MLSRLITKYGLLYFSAAGVPLFLPVAGVSVVGTSTIVHRSPYRGMARDAFGGSVGL